MNSVTETTNFPEKNITTQITPTLKPIYKPLPVNIPIYKPLPVNSVTESTNSPDQNTPTRLKSIGTGALFGALAPIAIPIGLALAGFGISGIIGGSIAAICQSPEVLKGSCFAVTQSFMATLMVCGNPIAVLVIFSISIIIGAVLGGVYGLDVF